MSFIPEAIRAQGRFLGLDTVLNEVYTSVEEYARANLGRAIGHSTVEDLVHRFWEGRNLEQSMDVFRQILDLLGRIELPEEAHSQQTVYAGALEYCQNMPSLQEMMVEIVMFLLIQLVEADLLHRGYTKRGNVFHAPETTWLPYA